MKTVNISLRFTNLSEIFLNHVWDGQLLSYLLRESPEPFSKFSTTRVKTTSPKLLLLVFILLHVNSVCYKDSSFQIKITDTVI